MFAFGRPQYEPWSTLSPNLLWAHFLWDGIQNCKRLRPMENVLLWPGPPDELLFSCQSPVQNIPSVMLLLTFPNGWASPSAFLQPCYLPSYARLHPVALYLSKFVSATGLWAQGLQSHSRLFPVSPAHSTVPSSWQVHRKGSFNVCWHFLE